MNDPVVMRRRLRGELKRLRGEANLTQREVAADLDWSPSKIIRMENGSVAVGVTDLRALLDRYGIHDKTVIDELVAMAKASKRQPFGEYREILSPDAIKYFGYESSASVIMQLEPMVMPGILQTEEYASALLKLHEIPESKAERYVASRRERQEILDRQEPPGLRFMVDESVLLRSIGGPAVMRRQLQHLLVVTRNPNVTVRVLPFAIGVHAGLRGPFVLLEFPDANDPDVLYLEKGQLGDRMFIDEPDVTSSYRETFWQMEDQASEPDELKHYVQPAMNALAPADRSRGEPTATS